MSDWKQAGENLVRHKGGTYYLRAKVNGKIIRRSLRTSDLRIAKLKRDSELASQRTAAAREDSKSIRTVGDAINLVAVHVDQPRLKDSTREDYRKIIAYLRQTLPVTALGRTWSRAEASSWWKQVSSRYAAQRANRTLLMASKVAKALIDHGIRTDDPTEGLKRMRVKGTAREIPSRDDIEGIVTTVRRQGKRHSEESANFIAFLAFTGCRIGETRAVEWKDVGDEWLLVTGGESGTKNHQQRRLPISPTLKALLDRMRYPNAAGPLFHIKSPRIALDNACERLEVPHLRIHDLRHFFVTWAIEQGVEIPTIAKWVGHQDGGALLMKTYGHLRDQHSLDQAKLLG